MAQHEDDESPRLRIPDSVENSIAIVNPAPPPYGLNYGGRSGRYSYANGGESRQRALREYLNTVLEYRYVIIACTLLGLLFGYHVRTKQILMYESSSLVSIGSYVPPVDGPTAEALKFETSKGEYLENLIPILKSYSLARTVLASNPSILEFFQGGKSVPVNLPESALANSNQSTLPADTVAIDAEAIPIGVLDAYIGTVSLFRQEGTSLLSITSTSSNQQIVAKIANAHAAGFMDAVRKQRFVWATTNVDFLRRRLADEEKAAVEAEEKMVDFARAHNIEVSGASRGLDQIANRLEGLTGSLNDIVAERITDEEAIVSVRRSLTSDGNYFSPETAIILPSLKKLETERDRLKGVGYPSYMIDPVEREIRDVRNFIKESARSALKLAQSKARISREKEAALRRELEKQQKSQVSRAELAVQFSVLEKDYKARREFADKTLARLEEAMVNAESDQKTVQMVDTALTPGGPILGRRISSLVSGSLLGCIFGFALAFFFEYHRGAVRTPSDVQTLLEVTLLGIVPAFSKDLQRLVDRVKLLPNRDTISYSEDFPRKPDRFSRAFELMIHQNIVQLAGSDGLGIPVSSLAVTLKPHSRESEAFRNIRAALKFCSRSHPPRRILITSGQKGDGKTTLTVNLAASIAQTSARTIVIDADLRMPTVHGYFQQDRERRGLGDYLLSPARISDFIQPTDVEHLSVMLAGTPVSNPAELIGSRRMLDLIELVSEEYDYVFIDTPPVGEIADALLLCQAVDGCVLVARSGVTSRAALQLAFSRLTQVRARVLGAALNGLSELDGKGDGYYGRYSYRSGNG